MCVWSDGLIMVGWNGIILVLMGVLSLCGVVRADMVPLSPLDAGNRPSPQTCIATGPRATNPASTCVAFAGIPDLRSPPLGFLPEPTKEVGQTSAAKPAQILSDEQNSLSLCLYALLSVGLCYSVPSVKKLHFGCIPDWYHSGGPCQIGHSLAISPDCLCSAPIYCFIQPEGTVEDRLPQYYRATVASLLRKSQLTPTGLSSRGPPCMS